MSPSEMFRRTPGASFEPHTLFWRHSGTGANTRATAAPVKDGQIAADAGRSIMPAQRQLETTIIWPTTRSASCGMRLEYQGAYVRRFRDAREWYPGVS